MGPFYWECCFRNTTIKNKQKNKQKNMQGWKEYGICFNWQSSQPRPKSKTKKLPDIRKDHIPYFTPQRIKFRAKTILGAVFNNKVYMTTINVHHWLLLKCDKTPFICRQSSWPTVTLDFDIFIHRIGKYLIFTMRAYQ